MISIVPVLMMQQRVLKQQREHARRQAEHRRQRKLKIGEDRQKYRINNSNIDSIVLHPRKETV